MGIQTSQGNQGLEFDKYKYKFNWTKRKEIKYY